GGRGWGVLCWRAGAGEGWGAQRKEGEMVKPMQAAPKWTAPREDGGGAVCPVRPWRQTLGRLLVPTPPRRRVQVTQVKDAHPLNRRLFGVGGTIFWPLGRTCPEARIHWPVGFGDPPLTRAAVTGTGSGICAA